MPSSALKQWETTRREALDEIQAAHKAVGGTARGRRFATLQVNHAYTMLLSSQFQGFCRDLHSEAVTFFVSMIMPAPLGQAVSVALMQGRKLDHGNPNPGNLGADFGRLGMQFWPKVIDLDTKRNPDRLKALDALNDWRNAIAHQDWAKMQGAQQLHLQQVRRWRSICSKLATHFDDAVSAHLEGLAGAPPW